MPAPLRTARATWIEEGLRTLGLGGPDAVRIENLAGALGVTKGGFYGHFENRGVFLHEMLDAWEAAVTDLVIEQVSGMTGDARTRLRRLFDIAMSIDGMVTVELAIREWARRDEAVRSRVRRIDNRRMAFMRTLFGEFCTDQDDIEVRCLLAFSLFIANPIVSADHGRRRRRDVIESAIHSLLR